MGEAELEAREFQISLTSCSRDPNNPIPMCGVPWHAVDTYVAQLVDKGYHIAICDQVEDPKTSKGLVKRAVTSVKTPGTVLDDANLSTKSHNYLGALCPGSDAEKGGFAWLDVSTGQWSGVDSDDRQSYGSGC